MLSLSWQLLRTTFKPHSVSTELVEKEICKLNAKKIFTRVNINLWKDNVDVCAPKLTELLNSCISKGVFPDELKLEDISPIFKSVDCIVKKNL